MAEPISSQYETLEKIGHGSFGVIRKIRRKSDGKILCRKEISYLKMSQKEREQLHAEFQILSTLRHPNIVGYYHREHLKETQDLYLYMEYCGNGDLGRVIKGLASRKEYAEEQFVWEIFSQLVTALYRCHYGVNPPSVGKNVLEIVTMGKTKAPQGAVTILHRDLKPENVFLGENNSVKLGDFGLSKMIQSHDFASTYVGTPFYMSPEICAAERYTLKSDIWSLGCIIYELCAREPPFNAKTHFQLVQKIKEGKVPPLPRVYSGELMAVIKDCLRVNPDLRPDTATLLNLPVIRLMRKEREAVEFKMELESRNNVLSNKLKQVEEKLANIEADKLNFRQEIDSQLRREWEVKARLEIDRLVNEEIEQLQRRFEAEVEARVQEELQKKRVSFGPVETHEFTSSQVSRTNFFLSMAGSTDSEFPSTTDITEFSVNSPEEHPLKRSSRAPFARAQTMFERNPGTPMSMDIDMASPSPMVAIASLSLSPRRNIATKAPTANKPPIFDFDDEEEIRSGRRDPFSSDSDDDDDHIIPSPTRPPRSNKNPFGPQRPILPSMKTAPINRLRNQTSMAFNKPTPPLPTSAPEFRIRAKPSNGALREKGDSPNRRLSKIPSVANLSMQNAENGGQRKSSLKKEPEPALTKVVTKNNIKGRTLVELQQARAGGRPVESMNVSPKRSSRDRFAEPAVWDPERDEMPSPFLVRKKQPARV
ncbi:kinase-like protein [Daldinia decipiens]|uniref:kinase-like protein n=1 Tax=Daldinia decipiens TaxID=326647 RepID=UPI0020C3BCDE|nr:kinase-like protein [Daldinia decipiens]KAI1658668.1 kinase-like protein [Daldinia decipiens]